MRVRVGNQTSCWAASVTEPFDYAVAHRFDAFEWFPDKKPGAGWDEGDLDATMRRGIHDTAQAHDIRLSLHARWQANPLAAEGNDLLAIDLELARDLGAVLFNIHLFHENGVAAFVEAIAPLISRTAEAGLQLSIENTPHHSPEQFNALFARFRALGSPASGHVGMCLDLGHANLSTATHNDYLAFCDRLDPEVPIIHVHLHENWGDTDSHLPLFTGPSARDDSGLRGLLTRLQQRDFSGSVILEQWPHPPSLLNNARDRLLTLWAASPVPPAQENARSPQRTEPKAAPAPTAAGFAEELAAGDRRSRSWREKLEFVSELLARESPSLTADEIINIAIYLRFLGTGEIACAEDGRHFRPAHHARIASQIHERLAGLNTSENQFILRKIYPWLPSSAPVFQRAEPLTRIRDIAHRNDLGSDLKREIKTTLQNKLHRCAGPEDLATSAALLERITAAGATYPPEFVEQFKLFHAELKEFFNARSVDERLEALLISSDVRQADLIRLFLQQKAGSTALERSAALRSLTELRRKFATLIAQKATSEAQELILADIALEDFAFVLLSQIINGSENAQPQSGMESSSDALTLALDNLALSGVDRAESGALGAELRVWGRLSPSTPRNELLRFRASVLRGRRLTEEFGARMVALFSEKAGKLGRALGVSDHASHIFAEAELRSQVVFQASKLADGLLRRIREMLRLPPWDVIVGGRAVGRAITLDSLNDRQRLSGESAILLLKHAEGDEEIPRNVMAIALAREIPHLSHLSVRARQAGIVFVACEDPREFESLQRFEGQGVLLTALTDKVTWEKSANESQSTAKASPAPIRIPEVRLAADGPLIPLERATAETSGGKADGMRRLAEVSRQKGAGFLTPRSLVVPFGVMEAALTKAATLSTVYRDLTKQLEGMEPPKFADATRRVQELVQQIEVPDVITAEIQRQFSANSTLAVRSSANCEDLEEFAGAGLYESVINVSLEAAAAAIRTVWASLWTRRAAESRRAGGVPDTQAHMAVLVQELLISDYSFVLHTVNPITHSERELYAEIVVGLGETLASAASSGSPYRLTCDKDTGAVKLLAFANFSQATRANPAGGLHRETVDYSRIELSSQPSALEKLGRRLLAIGDFVERALGGPQDIEGALVKEQVYLVQARAQQGLDARKRR